MIRAAILALAAALGAASAPVAGAPCAGFNDVDSADAFCPSVEWMKNRAVTTGCSPGSYCPAPDVSRLGMAAFMQRLGKTLTPLVRYADDAGGALDPDNGNVVCATAVVPAEPYPRSATVRGILSGSVAAAAGIALHVVESVNGGVSWSARNTQPAAVTGANRWLNASTGKGAIPVAPNTATQYGLRITRHGAGTANVVAWTCQLEAVYTSRTGSASPF
ncbi:MAG TPA: hypothetical protein VFX05_10335 [Casimicrobiaceae bacterium]|nr:hypothetical protein [Casimicrobiaceae bacterium]